MIETGNNTKKQDYFTKLEHLDKIVRINFCKKKKKTFPSIKKYASLIFFQCAFWFENVSVINSFDCTKILKT